MRHWITAIAAVCVTAGCATSERVTDLRQGQQGWLSYPSGREKLDLSGQLVLPASAGMRVPAMIIAHGSGGLDRRNERWASFLRDHGIATFQVDYFGPRGISAHSNFQPLPVQDAYDALRLIATHPRIDSDRIGIIGFSRGGSIALAAANAGPSEADGHRFAAHVAIYPSCAGNSIRRGGSQAPVLVLAGSRDELVPYFQCEFMAKAGREEGRDVTLKIYEGAHHGWDGDFSGMYFHRALNQSYTMQPDAGVTERSRVDVLAFLNRALGVSTADVTAREMSEEEGGFRDPYEDALEEALVESSSQQ